MQTASEPKAAATAAKTHNGSCFCGAVQLTVSGEPAAMGYCHCESCRSWSAGPVNAFTLWQPDNVKVTRGADLIGSYAKTPRSLRKWCTSCGGHLFTEHPHWGLIDVYAATIPDFPYQPGVHVNYQETRLHLRDGLPKLKDLPAEMGGSGVAIAE
ncbi:MAG TPA: GFA family protein [Burkholderiaceae bacterium]|nr:GFA family protein [Burkholderiaceae bacterium]